jgi:hypothetical protein
MAAHLQNRQVHALVSALGEAKIVNMEASLSNLLKPLEESLSRTGGGEAGFHVLCCDEYFLVTGVVGGNIPEVEQLADAIRGAVSQAQKG